MVTESANEELIYDMYLMCKNGESCFAKNKDEMVPKKWDKTGELLKKIEYREDDLLFPISKVHKLSDLTLSLFSQLSDS